MRVLIIADESFASRERSMLSRLEVGLADEGVRVVHAIPRRAAPWYHAEVFSQAVLYEDRGLPISRPWRARQVLRDIQSLVEGEERAVDLVHAFGRGSRAMAVEIVRQTGAALAVEVNNPESAAAAGRLRAPDLPPPVLFVPDPALERAIHADDSGLTVRLTPWGVHTPGAPRDILREGRDIAVMVNATGRDRDAMIALLEGTAAAASTHPDLMFFAEAEAVHASGIWPLVRRLGLSERFTLAPDVEARRELALRGDALVLPEALGEQRTLTLDAMAAGMVVIAAADPLVSVLVDTRTARLVDKPSAERWAGALRWLADSRDQARALALAAREHVRAQCRASAHVAAVMDAYEWMTASESIPFGADGERNVR
jgi:hypothetical protein